MGMGGPDTHRWIKNGRDTSGVRGPSARKVSPCNFCLQKPVGVGAVEETASS